MKNKSVFNALPQEDQQHILNLCANHTYDEVLEIIARPRPEGLQLKSSYSALCRFNCSNNADVRKATVLDQAAASLQFVRQRGSGSFRTAILTILETRIFEALRAGKSVTELKDDFAALKEVQKGFLAEEKWRHDPEVDAKKEYSEHDSHSLRNRHYDFVPCDENGQPTDIPPLSDDEINQLNECDDLTPEDIARLDHRIASDGRASAEKWAPLIGYPLSLVQQRVKTYEDNLRARGITPVQAAIEARRAKLLAAELPIAESPGLSTEKSTKKARKST